MTAELLIFSLICEMVKELTISGDYCNKSGMTIGFSYFSYPLFLFQCAFSPIFFGDDSFFSPEAMAACNFRVVLPIARGLSPSDDGLG